MFDVRKSQINSNDSCGKNIFNNVTIYSITVNTKMFI